MSVTRQVERILAASGMGWLLSRRQTWRGLLVLTYHRIGEDSRSPLDRRLWSATAEALETQLAFLKERFEVIGLDDLQSWVTQDHHLRSQFFPMIYGRPRFDLEVTVSTGSLPSSA